MTDLHHGEAVRAPLYAGADFSAGVVHGLLVSVSPDGWRVARRGRSIASGPETGARGLALAIDAAGAR